MVLGRPVGFATCSLDNNFVPSFTSIKRVPCDLNSSSLPNAKFEAALDYLVLTTTDPAALKVEDITITTDILNRFSKEVEVSSSISNDSI